MTSTIQLWQPSSTYAPVDLRKMDSALVMSDGTAIGSRAGIRPGDPGFAVTVAAGVVSVSAGTATLTRAGQGVYRAQLAATSPGTLAAASSSFSRIDLVYLRAWDTDVDGTGLRKADIVLLTGTPSATPSAPSPGATEIYLPLATITVPTTGAGGTGSATVSSAVRQLTVAPGGILPVTSTADIALAGSYVGQARYNTVRALIETWNGTAWVAQGDWTSYTPTWTSTGSAPAIGNGSISGRYTQVGRMATAVINLTMGSTTTFGTGVYAYGLPPGLPAIAGSRAWIGTAMAIHTGAAAFVGAVPLSAAGTVVNAWSPTGTPAGSSNAWTNTSPFTWTNTDVADLQITYEVA